MIKTPLYNLNRACTSCELREKCKGPVPAVGPMGAKVMIIGEAPGGNEDEKGEPWVGHAGQYRDALLNRIGLTRDDVISSNVVKCRPVGNADPTPEQAKFCGERWLRKEIELFKPEIIMTLGRIATDFILGEGETIEHRHGIPVQRGIPWEQVTSNEVNNEELVILPAYHPASGFYQTANMRFIQEDFAVLGKLVRGEEIKRPVDDIQTFYMDVTGVSERGIDDGRLVALDTETIGDKLWSTQLSDAPGSGFFHKGPEIPRLYEHMVVHNYMFDSRFIDLPEHTDDSMVMAYVLGLPQGLKQLAWRLCGMEMKSYTETISGYRKGKALAYLEKAIALHPDVPLTKTAREKAEKKGELPELDMWPNPPLIEDEKWDTKRNVYSLVTRNPQHINRKMKKALADVAAGKVLKNGPVDLWARWHAIDKRERAEVEETLGPMPDASLADIPRSEAVYYSARDPDATIRVHAVLSEELDAKKVRFAYEIDRQTLPIAREMEKKGIKVNLGHLAWLSEHYTGLLKEKSEEIFSLLRIKCPEHTPYLCSPCQGTGYWRFNPNSDKELRTLFFQHLGFKPTKLTKKTRLPSVEADELAKIKHPVVKLVEAYRHVAHLKNSFADPLQKWADEDHKIHTTINPTKTGTGRWSMKWPNLMQIPTRTELGQLVRQAFMPSQPDWSLFSADYSQIEMRVAAHLSQCTSMMQLFFEDRDIHTETAAEIFGVSVADVTKAMRDPAKTTGFGVIYGLTYLGLYTQMQAEGQDQWSEKDCEKFIKDYYRIRPELKTWQEETLSFARLNGFVKDMFGRIRYTPEMGCPIPRYRGDGERKAINMPVQSGAQGILKMAMVNLWRLLPKQNYPWLVKWLLQIHDELMWELPDGDIAGFRELVVPVMESAVSLSVPIKVETKVGRNWKEMS